MPARAVLCALCGAFVLFGQTPADQVQAHFRKAQEYVKANRPDLAAGEYSAIIALDATNTDARGNLGVLLFFQGNYGKAIPELRAVVQQRPELSKLRALLGMAEKRTGDLAAGRSDLEKAFPQLEEKKLRMDIGMELVELYMSSSELDKAAGVLIVLRQAEPENVDLLYTAQRVYQALADESLLAVAMLAPQSARMHQLMAHELAKQGNREGAIQHYRDALKLDPKLPGLHFELAEMLSGEAVGSGQEEAEKEYKAALQVNPFDAKSEVRLGEMAARRTDLKAAYGHYSRAVEVAPEDSEANLGLARILLLMKEPDKARPLLEKGVTLDPTNAIAHYRLAALYRTAGRTEDARRELALFQKYKVMKERLKDMYREMRLVGKQERTDPDEATESKLP